LGSKYKTPANFVPLIRKVLSDNNKNVSPSTPTTPATPTTLTPQRAQTVISTEEWMIQKSSIKVLSHLGAGNFGEVWKGEMGLTLVAIKMLNAKCLENPTEVNGFLEEAKLMQRLHNESIVQVYGVVEGSADQKLFWIVMEFMSGGSLIESLRDNKLSDIAALIKVALDVTQALEFLHQKGIIHRDIAARNILLTKAKDQAVKAKLSDFGLSRSLGGSGYYQKTESNVAVKWYEHSFCFYIFFLFFSSSYSKY